MNIRFIRNFAINNGISGSATEAKNKNLREVEHYLCKNCIIIWNKKKRITLTNKNVLL